MIGKDWDNLKINHFAVIGKMGTPIDGKPAFT